MHSKAVEMIHSEGGADICDLQEEALYTAVDTDIVLDGCESVVIVNASPGIDFLLSVSLEDAGVPRTFVGASSANDFRCQACSSFFCQHCLHVQSWLEGMEEQEHELGDIFDGFGLRGQRQNQSQTRMSNLPVSKTRLPPAFSSSILAGRAVCLGKSLEVRFIL